MHIMKSTLKCHRPWTGFEITDHLGDVRPCCWGKRSCGNINDQSPEEIWAGEGFQYYREKMSRGETEEICNSSCPILQEHYIEIPEGRSQEEVQSSVPSPRYLRVVPTTSCNLHCPMCYQADAPPTKLPADLFDLLKVWISGASEIQILGGETFLTRQCLEWIGRINPIDYPTCKLAAITNGLGFGPDVCSLIRERHWSWILVSIDAASDATYRRVRGGDFRTLLQNLDRLAEARARCDTTFEVRFGFTLQMSNLSDALGFLDLCADYAAMPQYTLVFGDWHNEAPSSIEDVKSVYATLEELDKRLWQRGFGNQLLAGPLAALKERQQRILESAKTDAGSGGGPLSPKRTGDEVTACIALELRFSEGLKAAQLLALKERMVSAQICGKSTCLTIIMDSGRKMVDRILESALTSLPVDHYSIRIPFFIKGEPISALWVYAAIDSILRIGRRHGWTLLLEPLELESLGLEKSNCDLGFERIYESGQKEPCSLSVVTPIYNCEQYVNQFLRSLLNQELNHPIEIILVDDGSTDSTVAKLLELLTYSAPKTHVLFLRRNRRVPYQPGTFTFSAGLAREVGLRQSVGDRVLFLDPDQIVEPNCIQEHYDWGTRIHGTVIGDRRTDAPDVLTTWSRLRSMALSSQPDWWLSFFTGNASVDRDLLERAGGFDPALQYWGLDDTDLGYRLFRLGSSVWHTPRAIVSDLAPDRSGGGHTREDRLDSYRLHMEVLYRKYLDPEILDAFRFAWPEQFK
jgi:glycosyltransferase involved in cell wall biosynthesis/pyruvate-formate lyase-activating enzyme